MASIGYASGVSTQREMLICGSGHLV